MPRWIDYQDFDDRDLEIGRPIIVPHAKRHQRHAAQPSRPSPPLQDKRVLILKQPGGVIMRRCRTIAEARAELAHMPPASGCRYEIRQQ